MTVIAFFDVDLTLLPNTSGFLVARTLIKKKLFKKRHFIQALFYEFVLSMMNKKSQGVKKLYEITFNDLAGMSEGEFFFLGKKIFEDDVKPRLFRSALQKIAWHQEQNHKIVILSSGAELILKFLGEYLKADAVYAVGAELRDGKITSKVTEPFCYGEGKFYYAEVGAKKFGADLKDCYFYSDHHRDLPLLKKVGNPVTVNPNRTLKKIAQQKHWAIEKWK